MTGLLFSVLSVLVGMASLFGVLLALYWLTGRLPARMRESARVWVFVGPAMFFLVIGLVAPALRTIYFSMLDDTGKTTRFVFLGNYREIFTFSGTRITVVNSLTWVVVGTLATVVIGLAIARFADGMRGEKTVKSLVFIPGAVSLVGAGIIWRFVYAGPPFKVGLANKVAGAIPGLPESMGGNGTRNWLLETGFGSVTPQESLPGFNTFLLIIIFIWASTGFAVVVFSAAIKGVPEQLIEAARVDGASQRQTFYQIVLPYIRATVVTVATTTTISGLKAFDIVAATTGGNFNTSTIANEFYRVKFVQGRDGLGSALAVLIFVLVIPVVVINRRAQRRSEEMMGG